MIATALHNQTAALDSAEYSMKGPFTVSVLFHVVLFGLTIVTVPFVTKPPIVITPIAVELVDIDDLTQTNKKPPPKVEDKPKPIEKPKKPINPDRRRRKNDKSKR